MGTRKEAKPVNILVDSTNGLCAGIWIDAIIFKNFKKQSLERQALLSNSHYKEQITS